MLADRGPSPTARDAPLRRTSAVWCVQSLIRTTSRCSTSGPSSRFKRGRCLAEAPQPRQRDAEDAAQQHAIDRIVGDDQHRVVGSEAGACARERGPGAQQHVFQRLAFRHQHLMRRVAPGLQAFAVAFADFRGEQAFPRAVGDFLEAIVGRQHRGPRVAEREFGGAQRARQRRSDGTIDAHVAQAVAERTRLRFTDRRQRDVFLALVAAFGIPRGFAVAGEQDFHASRSVIRAVPATTRRGCCAPPATARQARCGRR